jgi:hypothetical protein
LIYYPRAIQLDGKIREEMWTKLHPVIKNIVIQVKFVSMIDVGKSISLILVYGGIIEIIRRIQRPLILSIKFLKRLFG